MAARSKRPARRVPASHKAAPLKLREDDSVDDLIARILENCLDQVAANRRTAADGRNPEGVHQMRVGLRRLRAALKLIHRQVRAPAFADFDREAERLADALAPARNLDAVEDKLVAPRRRREVRRDYHALRAAARARRAKVYTTLRGTLRSDETDAFIASLRRWIDQRGWRSGVADDMLPFLAAPGRALAEEALDQLARKAARRGKGFGKLPARGRHKFRIALKKLRYAAKFFAPLYGIEDAKPEDRSGRKTERYLKRLAKLLDGLGEDHDAVTMPAVLKSVASAMPPKRGRRAVATVLRDRNRRHPALRKQLRKRRRQWKNAAAFW
jgi:triphosphatase